jgi:hypothetical protein
MSVDPDQDMPVLPAEAKFGSPHHQLPRRQVVGVRTGRAFMSLGKRVMRMSSSIVAPSTIAVMSVVLLCGLGGTAMSQAASSSTLPGVTVTAPQRVAKPHHGPVRTANTHGGHRRASAVRANTQTAAGTPAPGSVMARSLSEPAAIAPMVARQVSSTATNPGMDAPGQKLILNFRRHVETYATSRPTRSAGRMDCSWVPDTTKSGGIAAACSLAASCPGRRFRSPKSGNQDVASSLPPGGHSHETVVKLYRALNLRHPVDPPAVRPGRVANHGRLQPAASRHHGRSAETGSKTTEIAVCRTRHDISPGVENRSGSVPIR